MSQSAQKQATQSAPKEKYKEFNVDELLAESDDDDDEDEDELSDPEFEKFKQKEGLAKSATQVKVAGPSNPIDRSLQITQSQSAVQYTIGAQIPQPQGVQTTKGKSTINFDLSSDSDSSEDELDKEITQLAKNSASAKGKHESFKSAPADVMGELISMKNGVDIGESVDGILDPRKLISSTNYDIIDIIEKNEKMNEVGPEKLIEQGNQLLSFDNKFYNVQRKLLTYQDFGEISKKLHQQKNHQFGGIVSAIAVVQDYLFVGNSSGIIRVFDIKSQKEMKPLMDEANIGVNKVTCLDISEDGGFLISGYKKGQVGLWDLINYKLLRFISDIHTTEVVNAKIYHMDESENLYAVSSEDSGRVQILRFNKKTLLGGYNSEAQYLFKLRLKGTATISVSKKNELYPFKFFDNSSIISFGSLNEIVVCSMRPIKEIVKIERPSFCKEKSIPYIDWGFGLTPSYRERTVPIMAFAWDRLIQLVFINETTSTVEMDGFYYSDQEINSIYFVSDSILFVLVNGREVKLLYTTKFYPGHFKFLEQAKKDDLLNNQFEKVISVTAHSELEKGFEVSDIKSTILQCQTVMNYNQCVKKYKAQCFFMCGKNIVRAKVYSWKEYLDHMKYKENQDWLTVLKVALEIYNGEAKGYAKVPDEKEIREGILKGYMKDQIKDSVQQVIYKFNSNKTNTEIKPANSTETYQADSIAIKVAIEFCLSINATFFLFTEIYQIFVDQTLEHKFIQNLEPFLLSGQFKKEIIPETIVQKIIQFYEERQNYKVLEKVIQQLDLTDYSHKTDLIVTCEVNCLISALLYLMSTQTEESLGCMQILNTMLKVMMGAKNIDIQKEDIQQILKVDSAKKYEIEKSRAYIGYKLIWIMKIFLDGKMYPSGFLPPEKHRIHVYDIANFITNDYVLDELLLFDSETFFKMTSKMFVLAPYKLMLEQKEFLTKNLIKGTEASLPMPSIINELFLKKCNGNPLRLEQFYKFLITVQSCHEYIKNQEPLIKQELFLQAVVSLIESKSVQMDEKILIKALQGRKLKQEDINKLLFVMDSQTKSWPLTRIFLVEKKKDYVQSLKLNLTNQNLRKNIFEWINSSLDKLSSHGAEIEPYEKLKEAIQRSIRDIIAINVEQTVKLLDRWFEDSYQEQLIVDELAEYPEVQFNFLKKFLTQNEAKIQQTIIETTYSSEKKAEAQRYIQYLVLNTKLLCKYQRDQVHEFIKKDYYPVAECLQICRDEKIEKGVAELLKRNGSYIESLNTYLGIINKLDTKEIVMELYSSVKSSKSPTVQSIKWEFQQCQKLKTVQEFDTMLHKAIKIAQKHQTVIGEEGWFIIFEFLSDYRTNKAKQFQGTNGTMKTKDKAKVDLLKDFVTQRKDLVLKLVPPTISLQVLTDRLNLDFKQIKDLYDHNIKTVRNNEKYLKLAKVLQEKELLNLSQDVHKQVVSFTFLLTAKFSNAGTMSKRTTNASSVASHLASQFRRFLSRFSTADTTTISTASKRRSVLSVQNSPQVSFHLITCLEIQSKEVLRKKTKDTKEDSKDEKKERNMAFMQAQAESAFTSSPEKVLGLSVNNIFIRKLEAFDETSKNSGLNLKNFL